MGKSATIPAGKFKATCLALLDEVASTGRDLVITKRGRPVAVLRPFKPRQSRPLAGSIVAQTDLISPLDLDWESDR
jgi:prevent-host-death family protein